MNIFMRDYDTVNEANFCKKFHFYVLIGLILGITGCVLYCSVLPESGYEGTKNNIILQPFKVGCWFLFSSLIISLLNMFLFFKSRWYEISLLQKMAERQYSVCAVSGENVVQPRVLDVAKIKKLVIYYQYSATVKPIKIDIDSKVTIYRDPDNDEFFEEFIAYLRTECINVKIVQKKSLRHQDSPLSELITDFLCAYLIAMLFVSASFLYEFLIR